MLIESIIRRKTGTSVLLGTRTYNFQPSKTDPRHVADVVNEDDIQTLLAIKEGYRIAKSATAAAPAAAPAPTKETPAELSVAKGKDGKWVVMNGTKPVSDAYATKSEADAELAVMEKAAGQ
jgi:hypothetical protein